VKAGNHPCRTRQYDVLLPEEVYHFQLNKRLRMLPSSQVPATSYDFENSPSRYAILASRMIDVSAIVCERRMPVTDGVFLSVERKNSKML
jgi:hypothetical protein